MESCPRARENLQTITAIWSLLFLNCFQLFLNYYHVTRPHVWATVVCFYILQFHLPSIALHTRTCASSSGARVKYVRIHALFGILRSSIPHIRIISLILCSLIACVCMLMDIHITYSYQFYIGPFVEQKVRIPWILMAFPSFGLKPSCGTAALQGLLCHKSIFAVYPWGNPQLRCFPPDPLLYQITFVIWEESGGMLYDPHHRKHFHQEMRPISSA